MFPFQRIVPALTLGLLITQAAVAQQDSTRKPVTIDSLTVTAERRPIAANASSSTVRVLDRGEIMRRPMPDLLRLLSEIPGIQLDQVVGSGAGVSLQGLGSDRVLILVDGAPLSGRLNGQLDLTRIAPSQLSRIEVVDGPQSTLYGSSALGGVVNLLTRRDLGNRAELAASVGSFGERDARTRVSGLLGGTGVSLDLGRRTVDVVPGRVETALGFADRWDAMARITRGFGAALGELRVLRTEENQQYRTGTATSNANDNWQTDLLASLTLGGEGHTDLRAHASLYDHRLVVTPAAPAPSSKEWLLQRLADVEGVHRASLGAHRLVFGARGEREWVSSPRISQGERSQWNGALYGSAEWQLAGGLAVTTGARLTTSDTWGTNVTPRVGMVGNVGDFYAKAGVARGFRAPSFNELYLDFLQSRFFYAVRGNPDLAPEHSWNLTGEIGMARPGLSLYARGFGNRLRDFVETSQVGDSSGIALFTYQNIGQARTAGFETGGAVARGQFTLSGAYAFLDTENEATGQALFGRAAHTARVGLSWARKGSGLRVETVSSGRVPLSQTQAGISYQEAATRVNLNGTVALPHALGLSLGVDNLGDVVPKGSLSVLGRRLYAGFTWGIGSAR